MSKVLYWIKAIKDSQKIEMTFLEMFLKYN